MKYLLKFIIMFIVLLCVWVCEKILFAVLVVWNFSLNVKTSGVFTGTKGNPISIKEAWKEIIHLTKKDWK